MALTKTQFVRCVYLLLANSRKYSIPQAITIAYMLLDQTKAVPSTKERLLLLLNELDSGKVTPREFAKKLFSEYPPPSKKVKVLNLKMCD
jgi:hypothetical protein